MGPLDRQQPEGKTMALKKEIAALARALPPLPHRHGCAKTLDLLGQLTGLPHELGDRASRLDGSAV